MVAAKSIAATLVLATALPLGVGTNCFTGTVTDLYTWGLPNRTNPVEDVDLNTFAWSHYTSFMLANSALGFGLLDGSRTIPYTLTYKFTAVSNALVRDYIQAIDGTDVALVIVTVCGDAAPGPTPRALTIWNISDGRAASDRSNEDPVRSAITRTPLWLGYLVDLYCWYMPNSVAKDGAPLTTAPQNHSVGCALLPECQRGHYGLLGSPGGASTYSLSEFFDGPTNQLAVVYLNALKSTQVRGNVFVAIDATPSSNGMLTAATTIYDATGATSTNVSSAGTGGPTCFTGYLTDLFTWNANGTDLATAPESRNIPTAQAQQIFASGFGLLTGTSPPYTLQYKFDATGNGLVSTYVYQLVGTSFTANTSATFSTAVSICGTASGQTLTPSTIVDMSGNTAPIRGVSQSLYNWSAGQGQVVSAAQTKESNFLAGFAVSVLVAWLAA